MSDACFTVLKFSFKSALASLVGVVCVSTWWSLTLPEARAAEPLALSLSLDEALSRAKATSPEVTRARFALREADAHRVGAQPLCGRGARPGLHVAGGHDHLHHHLTHLTRGRGHRAACVVSVF